MISQNLKKLRLAHNLTCAELGVIAGVSPSSVSKLERGDVDVPRPETLKKLAEAFGVSVWVIMDEAEIPENVLKKVLPSVSTPAEEAKISEGTANETLPKKTLEAAEQERSSRIKLKKRAELKARIKAEAEEKAKALVKPNIAGETFCKEVVKSVEKQSQAPIPAPIISDACPNAEEKYPRNGLHNSGIVQIIRVEWSAANRYLKHGWVLIDTCPTTSDQFNRATFFVLLGSTRLVDNDEFERIKQDGAPRSHFTTVR